MKRPRKHRWPLIVLGIVLIGLGFLREFVFLNVNYILSYKYGWEEEKPRTPAILEFLYDYSYYTLYQSKWVLTVLFAAIFVAMTLLAIWMAFRKRKFLWWTLIFFGALLLVAGISFAIGFALKDVELVYYEKGYRLSRRILGFIQSPLSVLVLLPAFRLAQLRPKAPPPEG
ncbi:MAG: hypothetical protein ACFB10_19965 [Salibacteraceae bacterium]